MANLDAEQLRTTELASRIDQLIGWAKVHKTRESYVMRVENVDRLRNDIIAVIVAELSDPEPTQSQQSASPATPAEAVTHYTPKEG